MSFISLIVSENHTPCVRWHVECLDSLTQVIAIVMDTFTDVDIFKETVDASIRGVPVYVLLDHFHLKSFLTMAENQDVKIQQLRVSLTFKAGVF